MLLSSVLLTIVGFTNAGVTDGLVIGKRLRDFSMYGTSTNPVDEQLLYKYNYTFVDENYPVKIEISLPNTPFVSGIKNEIPHRQPPEKTILTLCEVEVNSGDSMNAAAIGGFSAAVAVLFMSVVVLVLAVLKLRSQLEHVPGFTWGFCCTIQKKEEPQTYTDLQITGSSNGVEYENIMETKFSV